MNMRVHGLLAAGVLAVTSVACEQAPLAPAPDAAPILASAGGAERDVYEHFYDMTDYIIRFSCDEDGNPLDHLEGEPVRMQGGIFSRFVAVMTPAGNVLVNYKTMPVGLRGVGDDSGEEFRVREAESGNSLTTEKNAVNPYRYSLTMTGTQTGRRMTVVYSGMFNVHDSGIIVDRAEESLECRAGNRG